MTGVGCCGTWRWPPDVVDDNVVSSADIVRPEPQPLGGLHRLRTLENLRQRRHLQVGSPVSIDSSNCGGRISSVWVSLTSRNSPSRIETVRLGRVEPGGDR